MGVILRRGILVALTGAAVLLPLRRHRPTTDAPLTPAIFARLADLRDREETAALLWSAAESRDSALAMPAVGGANTAPVLALAGFGGRAGDAESRGRVNAFWRAIGRPAPGVGVAILGYNSGPFQSMVYNGAAIRMTSDSATCRAIIPAFALGDSVRLSAFYIDQALAPCAFLAAFGVPGPQIRAWLQQTRFVAARSIDWLVGPSDHVAHTGPFPASCCIRSDERGSVIWSLARPLGLEDLPTLLHPPYGYGTTALDCLTGHDEACRRSVLHPTLKSPPDSLFGADLTAAGYLLPDSGFDAVRPVAPFYLGSVVSAFGRVRFGRFWRSALPVDSAFRDAFGVTLGAWTERWAKRTWNASFEARFRSAAVLLGPATSGASIVGGVIWSVIALLAAVGVVGRRTS